MSGYNQFLFSSGDGVHWLAATKVAVVGEYYENELRDVVASSSNADAHQVRWYRRTTNAEDPWISMQDHTVEAGNVFMYGGNSKTSARTLTILQNNGGAEVYLRAAACPASTPPSNGAVGTCAGTLALSLIHI